MGIHSPGLTRAAAERPATQGIVGNLIHHDAERPRVVAIERRAGMSATIATVPDAADTNRAAIHALFRPHAGCGAPQHACGNARDDGIRWHVARDDCAGADERALAHG